MAFGEVMVLGVGLIVLVLVLRVARYDRAKDARAWAAAYGVTLTDSNVEFVHAYLRAGRRLRFVCSLAGLLLPPLVLQAVDPASRPAASFPGLVVGYLVGSLWSELALPRPSTEAVRMAALSPRRLSEYVPARLRWGTWVVAVSAAALGVATLVVPMRDDAPTVASPSGAALGVVALVLAAAIEAAERWVLRRPQPFVVPDLVAADDAVRSSSIHAIAGSGACCLLLLLAAPAVQLAGSDVQALRWGMPWLAVGSFIGALVAIRYYVYRAWRVRRPVPPMAVG